MTKTRWAILGPGSIAESFASSLPQSQRGVLHAVASRDRGRAADFAARYGASHSGTYTEILSRDDVDAVYISTVHTTHAQLAIAALEAGKAVLCEKPLAPSLAETELVLAAAERAGLPVVEAYKHRFGPFAHAVDELLRHRRLRAPIHLRTAFGFEAPSEARKGRLFDPLLAGGAIFDVGGYPVALAVGLAASAGVDLEALRIVISSGHTTGGVDVHSTATIDAPGFTADVECSIVTQLPKSVDIVGADARLRSDNVYGTREQTAAQFTLLTGGSSSRFEVEQLHPFAAEADALSSALAAARLEAPEVPWQHSRVIARLLDDWHAAVLTQAADEAPGE